MHFQFAFKKLCHIDEHRDIKNQYNFIDDKIEKNYRYLLVYDATNSN